MGKKTIKDTEWVKEQIPVKLDENGNVVNKETGEPVGEKIFDMIGEGEPTIDMNPDKERVLYFDKTSGIVWVCIINEEDNNVWKSNTGNWVNSTINKLDIFGDGSCIALYQLDENANDTGGEYDGQWKDKDDNDVDGVYTDSKFGKAASFDGDKRIKYEIDNIVPDVKYTISFSAMLDADASYIDDNTGHGFIYSHEDDKDRSIKFSDNDNGKLALRDMNGAGDNVEITSTSLDKGRLYHIAVVFNDTIATCYVNGEKELEVSDIASEKLSLSFIGAAQRFFVGLIDQVRIFNRTLTDDEVNALYKEGGN